MWHCDKTASPLPFVQAIKAPLFWKFLQTKNKAGCIYVKNSKNREISSVKQRDPKLFSFEIVLKTHTHTECFKEPALKYHPLEDFNYQQRQ